MSYGNDFEDLVGKKILALHGDGDTLEFVTPTGVLQYGCEGDCCSSSWFAHISGIDNLVGHTVTKTENIALDSITPADETGRDCLVQYGFRISTDKGYFEIDMRNESNGYYGGYIIGPSEKGEATAPKLHDDF